MREFKEWPDTSGEDDHGRDAGGGFKEKFKGHSYQAHLKPGAHYDPRPGANRGNFDTHEHEITTYEHSDGKQMVSVDHNLNTGHTEVNHAVKGKSGRFRAPRGGNQKFAAHADAKAHMSSKFGIDHQVKYKESEAMDAFELFVEDGVAKSASLEALRSRVSDALENHLRVENNDPNCYCYVVNMYPGMVVYSCESKMYARDYADTSTGFAFGPAEPVEDSWTPIPAQESMQESASERVSCSTLELCEAYDAASGTMTVTVIQPGFNKNKGRYYPADVLKRDHKIFEGAKMFADHQTDKQLKEKPEGSVRDWVGQLKEVWAEADGRIRGKAVIIDPPFKAKMDRLQETGLLQEQAISIRASGEAVKKNVEGVDTNYVESLLKARSVDFVTYAGAGGQVEAMSEADEADLETINVDQLRTARPDLVKLIESAQENKTMKTVEQQLAEARAQVTALETEKTALETRIQESEKKARKATAATEIAKLVEAAKLPKAAKDKLAKQFAEAETVEGVQEAITAEADYLKSVGGLSIVKTSKKLGAEDNEIEETTEEQDAKSVTALVESFKSLGLSKDAAEIAARL